MASKGRKNGIYGFKADYVSGAAFRPFLIPAVIVAGGIAVMAWFLCNRICILNVSEAACHHNRRGDVKRDMLLEEM